MSWESSTERSVTRAQSSCPICTKTSKRDYPAGQTCSVCGYQGAWPGRIPVVTDPVTPERSLLDRTPFHVERRRRSRVTEGDIPDHWIPVRPLGIDDGAFMALYELGWLAFADPLDDVHLGQGELPL